MLEGSFLPGQIRGRSLLAWGATRGASPIPGVRRARYALYCGAVKRVIGGVYRGERVAGGPRTPNAETGKTHARRLGQPATGRHCTTSGRDPSVSCTRDTCISLQEHAQGARSLDSESACPRRRGGSACNTTTGAGPRPRADPSSLAAPPPSRDAPATARGHRPKKSALPIGERAPARLVLVQHLPRLFRRQALRHQAPPAAG